VRLKTSILFYSKVETSTYIILCTGLFFKPHEVWQ